MSDTLRRDVLEALGELSAVFPEWRLGQMIANLAVVARGPADGAIWDLEDEELLAAIRHHLDKHRDRQPISA
jgi:uncharacterized membrane protein YqjE